jgi:UDP-N-acetylglucosamine/UDP-N-acetylgalactosamine diphosphorylase
MVSVPNELRQRLTQYGQEHVLTWWDELTDTQRRGLLDQLQAVDLEQLRSLYAQRNEKSVLPTPDRITPLPRVHVSAADADQYRRMGEEALRKGEVAVLMVAGGQGSRLGFEHPKGMYSIGPVSNKTLFQIHAEKVLALGRRHGRSIPFFVMTSPATHDETLSFFAEKNYFGLATQDVVFFCQGTMPALDLQAGKLLMEQPGRLFTGPNGHGGTLTGLAEHGLLDRLQQQGVRSIYYFQVDNPLVVIGDPVFLGYHLAQDAEVSSKVLVKQSPADKLGNFVLVDGRCTIIEYSDLPAELARQTDEQGRLRLWAGSPAIHVFDRVFLEKVTQGEMRIPWHVARKKVPHVDAKGQLVQPTQENALKFETFIFDVLPRAERWTVMPTERNMEFEPLKNATGPDSPQTVRKALSDLAGAWLEHAGVQVPRQPDGHVAVPLEISPLYALDAEELARKVDRGLRVDGPLYLA